MKFPIIRTYPTIVFAIFCWDFLPFLFFSSCRGSSCLSRQLAGALWLWSRWQLRHCCTLRCIFFWFFSICFTSGQLNLTVIILRLWRLRVILWYDRILSFIFRAVIIFIINTLGGFWAFSSFHFFNFFLFVILLINVQHLKSQKSFRIYQA